MEETSLPPPSMGPQTSNNPSVDEESGNERNATQSPASASDNQPVTGGSLPAPQFDTTPANPAPIDNSGQQIDLILKLQSRIVKLGRELAETQDQVLKQKRYIDKMEGDVIGGQILIEELTYKLRNEIIYHQSISSQSSNHSHPRLPADSPHDWAD